MSQAFALPSFVASQAATINGIHLETLQATVQTFVLHADEPPILAGTDDGVNVDIQVEAR